MSGYPTTQELQPLADQYGASWERFGSDGCGGKYQQPRSYAAGKLVPAIATPAGGVVREVEAGLFISSKSIGTNCFDAQSDVRVTKFSGAVFWVAAVRAKLWVSAQEANFSIPPQSCSSFSASLWISSMALGCRLPEPGNTTYRIPSDCPPRRASGHIPRLSASAIEPSPIVPISA